MRKSSLWQKHPLLRLLLPLIIGIVCADAFPAYVGAKQSLLFGAICVSFLLLALSLLPKPAFLRRTFPMWMNMNLIGIGMLIFTVQDYPSSTFPFTNKAETYLIRMEADPVEKERSVLCESVLLQDFDTTASDVSDKRFLLYLAKDSLAFTLHKGDELLIHARLAAATNNGIPDEFDYPRYLRRKGICGTAYVPSGSWKPIGKAPSNRMEDKRLAMRESLIQKFQSLGFEGDELAILSALTIGDKEDLSEDIKEVYSISGAIHVLALSGLHIGLLYAVLWLLLFPVWRWHKTLKIPCVFLIVGALWLFAYFTGFPASVVRSVLMFSLVALSSLFSERPHTLNTLAAAAFLMLLIRPSWLFEVGFQLSFAAVTAIVWLQPKLSALLPTKHWLLRKVWELLTVSVAAQIGVAPLIAFYFHRFSVHFLLTNLWVIPLVTLVMYGVVLMLLLTPFPLLQQGMSALVNFLLKTQNQGLESISRWPFASVERIWIDVWEVMACYVVVYLLYRYFIKPVPRYCLTALGALLALLVYHQVVSYTSLPKPALVFYNVRGCPAVHCVANDGTSWIAASDSLQRVKQLLRLADPHWMRQHLDVPTVLPTDYQDDFISQHRQIVTYAGKRICLLNDDRWRRQEAETKMPLDILYISNGYRGTLREMLRLFEVKEVVLDASLSDFYRQRMEKECEELHIPLRHLSEMGIYTIGL